MVRTRNVALVVLLAGCGDDASTTTEPEPDVVPASIEITPATASLTAIGDTIALDASVLDQNGAAIANARVSWLSLDDSIAGVAEGGRIVAKAEGTARIVATSSAIADTAVVMVEQVATALVVTPDQLSPGQGDTMRLGVVLVDANGVQLDESPPQVNWSIQDETVATVSATGLLTVAADARGLRTTIEATADSVAGSAPLIVMDRFLVVRYRDFDFEILAMNEDGSGEVNLTNNEGDDLAPRWSPDGSRILFLSRRDGDQEIYVMNSDGSLQTNLTNDPELDFDPLWSRSGTRIAFASDRYGEADIFMMDADGGNLARLTDTPGWDSGPRLATEPGRIMFSTFRDGNEEIYLMNPDGTGLLNLTNHPEGDDRWPVRSPDGSRIAFTSNVNGNYEVFVMNADGTDLLNVSNDPAGDLHPLWSPDGSRIIFRSDRDGNREVYMVNVDGSNLANLTNHPADEQALSWSPDGRRLAFSSDREGHDDIYLMSADGSIVRVTTDEGDDLSAVWQPRQR